MSDEDIRALVRAGVAESYLSVRPRGQRAVRADLLLALARARLGPEVTEADLDVAVFRVGGMRHQVTSPMYALGQLVRRRSPWRAVYGLPAQLFDGLEVPSPLRRPRW